MLLKTILEYQRCYDLLREAAAPPLSKLDYMDALKAKGAFDAELEEHIKPINVEITT